MADEFEIKRNDLRPVFVVVLKDDFGEVTESPVNLTTAGHASGTAFFNMRNAAGTAMKVWHGTATITSAASGEVTYNWVAGNTNTAGNFEAEIEIIWNDGKPETFPGGPAGGSWFDVTITEDITGS